MWYLLGLLFFQFTLIAATSTNAVIPEEKWNDTPSIMQRLQNVNKKISVARKLRAAPGLGGHPESKSVATINTFVTRDDGVHLAIVRPFAYSQMSALMSSFDEWNKYPLGRNSCAGYSTDIILSFSGEDNNSLESKDVYEVFAAIQSLHANTHKWGGCVDSVELMFADIPASEDVYSNYHSMEGGKNKHWVNGPNRQFERMFRFVERKKKYDLWYLMEPDSHPIKSFWLDDIIGEITESSPFAILGSKYDGNAWNDIAFDMPLELLHHINGNAIYNVTNPLLLHIVSELESESHTDFNAIPFDLRISQIILEGSTGRQCAFIFDSSIELPNKAKKFESWWNEYASGYNPVKESYVLSNQASMVFTADGTSGASVVHGKNEFQLWNDKDHGSIALVIQANLGFDRQALASVLGSTGMNYFSEVVIISDDGEIDFHFDLNDEIPFKLQTRTSPKSMDMCQANITSDWFMVIDDKFQCADDMQILVSSDGKQRPLQAINPASSESCRKSNFCVDVMAEARKVHPAMNAYVLPNDALFHRNLRDEFCTWASQKMNGVSTIGNSNRYSMTSSVGVATSYFAFLFRIKATEAYDLRDKAQSGVRDRFIHRNEVPKLLAENVVDLSFSQRDSQSSIPFFWHIPKSGGTSGKDALSVCLGLTTASGAGITLEKRRFEKENMHYNGPDKLRVLPGHHMNVDVSREEGIKQAARLGLVESSMVKVIATPSLKFAIENLFYKSGKQAEIFAVFRHPVERAASLFHYLQVADWEPTYDPSFKNMTIIEWVESEKAENNWLIRSLLGSMDIPKITSHHFDAAVEFIDKKVLVGLTSRMEESMKRFRHYFHWDESSTADSCISDLINGRLNGNKHSLIKQGTKEWIALTKINKWDIALYNHILNVWETQGNTMFAPHRVVHNLGDIDRAMESIAKTEYQRSMQEYPVTPQWWYPDWAGDNKGCIMAGIEDRDSIFKYKTLSECCAKHYQWDWNSCMGTNGAIGPDGIALYYPDWEGDNKSCKNDGKQPTYMSNNVNAWMYEDLESCCRASYMYNLNACLGSGEFSGSKKWFVDSEQLKCVQDCNGPSPCGGLSDGWETTYSTPEACCEKTLWWLNKEECVFDSTGDHTAMPSGSDEYYVDWETFTCVRDCVGPAPCGGLARSWDPLYTSKDACCDRLPWVADCLLA